MKFLSVTPDGWRRLFRFAYSTSIIEKMKQYPGIFWNKQEKAWSVPWDLENRVRKEVFQ